MRTEGDLIKINDWLLPFSWIYGVTVRFRNWLFDMVQEEQVILHTHYLSGQHHSGRFRKDTPCGILDTPVARQSKDCRAITCYKRKSHGYVLAEESTTMPEIGDEPFQMHQKFSGYLCGCRCKTGKRYRELTE